MSADADSLSALAGSFVVPADVELTSVSTLRARARLDLGALAGEWVVTRANARTSSVVVSADTAALLRCFRPATDIVGAIVKFSRQSGADAEEVLRDAFPVLRGLIDDRLLVSVGSGDAVRIAPTLRAGDCVDQVVVLQCIQFLEDTEVYQAAAPAGEVLALKIVRDQEQRVAAGRLRHEATVLSGLDGVVTPRLKGSGAHAGRTYLLTEWRSGANVLSVGRELREDPGGTARARLHATATAIADAYRHLHRQGILHGDVNASNCLIDLAGRCHLLDFGFARSMRASRSAERRERGVVFAYMDPEMARARLGGRAAPRVSARGEQYAVAALVYRFVTGEGHLQLAADRTAALRTIARGRPRRFSEIGAPACGEVEGVLRRALSPMPGERFTSMAAFVAALREARPPREERAARRSVSWSRRARTLEARVLAPLGWEGNALREGEPRAPSAGLTSGAAGIAWSLYRMAVLRDEPRLLSLAGTWSAKAMLLSRTPGGIYSSESGITPRRVGRVALHHTASGVLLVRARTTFAAGDIIAFRESVGGFLAEGARRTAFEDVTLGRAGILLGCALLKSSVDRELPALRDDLRRLGDGIARQLLRRVRNRRSIERSGLSILGAAHGWAGVLYTLLLWNRTVESRPARAVLRRLDELAQLGAPAGRGLWWPVSRSTVPAADDPILASWCNGSAGFVFTWLEAHRATADPRYLEFAERAAWFTCEAPGEPSGTLCCGFAGGAYALLALHRHTGDPGWLARATTLFERAARAESALEEPRSLFKGSLGIALLGAELSRPAQARMPLYELEEPDEHDA